MGKNSVIPWPWRTGTRAVSLCPSTHDIAYLCRPNFNVEVTALIGNFQDFRPSKTIDSQSVFVNEEPVSAHTQLDVHAFRVLPSISHHWPWLELSELQRTGIPLSAPLPPTLKPWPGMPILQVGIKISVTVHELREHLKFIIFWDQLWLVKEVQPPDHRIW